MGLLRSLILQANNEKEFKELIESHNMKPAIKNHKFIGIIDRNGITRTWPDLKISRDELALLKAEPMEQIQGKIGIIARIQQIQDKRAYQRNKASQIQDQKP